MYKSKTIAIQVHRPWEAVFEFLFEPRNLPTWTTLPGGNLTHLSGTDWVTDQSGHRTIVRFPPRNEFGVLDHAVFPEDGTPVTTPTRVVPNGDGSEIQYTLYQRDGMSDGQFASEIEWLISDFQALKAMLESTARDERRRDWRVAR